MYIDMEPTTHIKGKCPHCGKETVVRNNQKILTSYPPQLEYKCTSCGQVWSAYNDIDAVKEESLMQIDDVTCTSSKETTGNSRSITTGEYTPKEYGWICPKCGRVNAPFVSCCPCFRGSGWGTLTSNTRDANYAPDTTHAVIYC